MPDKSPDEKKNDDPMPDESQNEKENDHPMPEESENEKENDDPPNNIQNGVCAGSVCNKNKRQKYHCHYLLKLKWC